MRTTILPTELAPVTQYYRARPQGENIVGAVANLPGFIRFEPINTLLGWYSSRSAINLFPTPEIDSLVARAATTLDQGERVRLLQSIVDLVHREYVTLPLVVGSSLFGAAAELQGWNPIRGTPATGVAVDTLRLRR